MMRYLRLYRQFLSFSFSRSLEYRLDFWFRIIMDCIFYMVEIAFFMVIYQHTEMLGEWTFDQTLIFVCGFLLVDAIHMTVFSNNMWVLPIYVNKGDLDYYLIRPVSSLFFLSLRDFAANSFLNLVIASGLLAWALMRYPEPIPPVNLLWYLFLLVNGAVLHYSLQMFFVIPVIWLHSNRGLTNAFFSTTKLGERPDKMVFPLLLMAAVPAKILFEGPSLELIGLTLGVSTFFFLLMIAFWNFALRHYSSASS
ncbi:MAG: ABC transporter permease [Planctomycetota bacterium]